MSGTPFGAPGFMSSVLRDPDIPVPAVPVALAVATAVNWRQHRLVVPVNVIARRLEVTTEYVETTVTYMEALGYLEFTGTNPSGRNVYRPRLPNGTAAQRGRLNATDKAA